MHDQRWHAFRVPAGLPVHKVPITRVQKASLIGLDIRILGHTEILLACSAHGGTWDAAAPCAVLAAELEVAAGPEGLYEGADTSALVGLVRR